jgi:MFS family permease
MFNRLNKIYHEFPKKFWVVVLASFISGIGSTLLFPFFSLYITQKFHVGMTTAGVLLGISSFFGLLGSMIGGALTDKFGRKRLVIIGLVFGALSDVTLGLVNRLALLYPLVMVIGLLGSIGGPAQNAIIVDLLPEKQRPEGFGVMRVAGNLAWIVGPTIGGFVANRSFLLLFLIDAVLSCVVAGIFYRMVPETKPETPAEKKPESVWQTVVGYRLVLRDLAFMAFLLASMLMMVVYIQMYNSMPVYLRDYHNINPQGYGFLLTSSAITVVLFQFWLMRVIKGRAPFLMMALGTLFYTLGFTMIGFISAYALFVLSIVVITVGEMIVVPTSQALVANFAPAEMRGRYMAVFGLSWALPATIGPGAAGYILDHFNPNLLWYGGGLLCAVAALGYYALHLRLGKQSRFAPEPEEKLAEAVPTA